MTTIANFFKVSATKMPGVVLLKPKRCSNDRVTVGEEGHVWDETHRHHGASQRCRVHWMRNALEQWKRKNNLRALALRDEVRQLSLTKLRQRLAAAKPGRRLSPILNEKSSYQTSMLCWSRIAFAKAQRSPLCLHMRDQ
jgi:hypothetical protein